MDRPTTTAPLIHDDTCHVCNRIRRQRRRRWLEDAWPALLLGALALVVLVIGVVSVVIP